jgi:hypothetical protein
MAKDSVRELPLRHPAVSVSTRVAVYVAEQMVDRVRASTDGEPTSGLDWLHLLQHFLAHPDEAEGADANTPWWSPAARETSTAEPNATDSGPTFHQPKFITRDELARRAQEPTKQQLEELYTALEIGYEKQWRRLVDNQFILDSAVWGGIVSGLAGAITAPLSLRDGHDSVGNVFAAIGLGLLLGAALGMGGVALFTWLGTLIDSGPGALVAMLLALTGLTVASIFSARAVAQEI